MGKEGSGKLRRVCEQGRNTGRSVGRKDTRAGVGAQTEGTLPVPKALPTGLCLWPLQPRLAALLRWHRAQLRAPAGCLSLL